jgi:multidrug efflux system outer membrane protein
MKSRLRLIIAVTIALSLQSCTSSSSLDENINDITLPEHWGHNKQSLTVESNWLAQLGSAQVQLLVKQALSANYQLKASAYDVEIKKQAIIVSGSTFWPELDLSFRSGRSKNNDASTYSDTNSVNLNIGYEIDLWGKLSDADREANLSFLAGKANFAQSKQQLVVDVVTTWFAVIEAEQLLKLYLSQVKNSQQNLDIIEAGYRSGLGQALDVYLSRNQLNNKLARVEEQKSKKITLIRSLERLVGGYPHGHLLVESNLPLLTSDIPLGLPADLIRRKPSLKAHWYQLLAKDASLAYAHKQRFPRLRLSASVGDAKSDISDLLSGSSLAWSLFGNIAAPIFNAGRLEANEESSRLALKQGEQQYLDALYSAFYEVENAITLEKTLKSRYQTMLTAQQNAEIAETLSFEQYQSGLVSYTTVLDAQNRSFDAQSTLIQLKKQLLVNRINLHFSLAGDFTTPSLATKVK